MASAADVRSGPSCGLKYLSHIVFLATWDLYLLPGHLLGATPCLSCFCLLYGVADILCTLADNGPLSLTISPGFLLLPHRIFDHLASSSFLQYAIPSSVLLLILLLRGDTHLVYLLVRIWLLISYLLFFHVFSCISCNLYLISLHVCVPVWIYIWMYNVCVYICI